MPKKNRNRNREPQESANTSNNNNDDEQQPPPVSDTQNTTAKPIAVNNKPQEKVLVKVASVAQKSINDVKGVLDGVIKILESTEPPQYRYQLKQPAGMSTSINTSNGLTTTQIVGIPSDVTEPDVVETAEPEQTVEDAVDETEDADDVEETADDAEETEEPADDAEETEETADDAEETEETADDAEETEETADDAEETEEDTEELQKGGKKIGEGAYGCVHKPSLTCKGTVPESAENKISKVMDKAEAKSELKQYDTIQKIDTTNNFYLGVPTQCEVGQTNTNKKEIAECKNQSINDINNKSLLIMDYGGIDLWKYGLELKEQEKTDKTVHELNLFLTEFHRCIKGIQLFIENGYLHYDIKPDNVIYDKEKHRINYIDFGLMKSKISVYEQGKQNKCTVLYHTTYSLEHYFFNESIYNQILLGSPRDKIKFIQNLKKIILIDTHINPVFQNISASFNKLFRIIKRPDFIKRILLDYEEFIMLPRQADAYVAFMKVALNKFDIYGLGITLIHIINCTEHIMESSIKNELLELAYRMINPNIYTRINIIELDSAYKKILYQYIEPKVAKFHSILSSHQIIYDGVRKSRARTPLVHYGVDGGKLTHKRVFEIVPRRGLKPRTQKRGKISGLQMVTISMPKRKRIKMKKNF